MQDLDLLDKSGVRQHFRFVANRYDVAKAPWEDIHWRILYVLRKTKGIPKGNALLYELRATSLIIL